MRAQEIIGSRAGRAAVQAMTALALVTGLVAPAWSQSAETPTPPPAAAPSAIPEKQAPPQASPPGSKETDQTGKPSSVIVPPPVDLGIKVPAPAPNDHMPVIAPPGTPGGDPKVVPK